MNIIKYLVFSLLLTMSSSIYMMDKKSMINVRNKQLINQKYRGFRMLSGGVAEVFRKNVENQKTVKLGRLRKIVIVEGEKYVDGEKYTVYIKDKNLKEFILDKKEKSCENFVYFTVPEEAFSLIINIGRIKRCVLVEGGKKQDDYVFVIEPGKKGELVRKSDFKKQKKLQGS